MTTRSPMTLGLAALVLTACAMAFGSPPAGQPAAGAAGTPTARAPAPDPLYGPVRCALEARPSGGGLSLAGRVTATRPLTGEYSLRVRGRGVSIDQGGPFSLAAGETGTLGQASLPGRARDYELRLIVEAGGRRVACPVETG
jgi:hypothetical protein